MIRKLLKEINSSFEMLLKFSFAHDIIVVIMSSIVIGFILLLTVTWWVSRAVCNAQQKWIWSEKHVSQTLLREQKHNCTLPLVELLWIWIVHLKLSFDERSSWGYLFSFLQESNILWVWNFICVCAAFSDESNFKSTFVLLALW